MARADRPGRLTIRFKRNEERSAVAVAGLPLTQKVVQPRRGIARIFVLNSRDLRHRKRFLVAVLEVNDDRDRIDRGWFFLRRLTWVGAMGEKNECPYNPNYADPSRAWLSSSRVQGMAETGRLYGNPDALTFKLENAPMPSARGRRPLLTKY